jgi:predicted nucleic acid-binding protein
MKLTAYLETSVISYLTAHLSSDPIMAGHQQATRKWWDHERIDFDIFVSLFVLKEVAAGDPGAAAKRVEAVKDLTVLPVTADVAHLAKALMAGARLPPKADTDALHIAVAAVHRIDYLLTWNCRHIDNIDIKDIFVGICMAHNLKCPKICSPEDLLTRNRDED